MVYVEDEQLAVVEFRATVLAETRSQWIRGEVGQTEIRKSSEQAGITPDVLVSAHHELVGVATRCGRAGEIVHSA